MIARAVVVGVLAGAATAAADVPRDTPAAIEVDREDAPPGRTELGFDGGAPVDGWGVTVAGGWLERPATFPDGARPVRRRESLVLGGAVALGPSVVIDARLAAAHQVGDRLRPAEPRALARFVAGDLRLGARLRVTGGARRALFVRADLTLPTGGEGDFAGEPRWSLAWRLAGRVVLPGGMIAAASAGLRLRGAEVLVADRLVGDELLVAGGLVVPLPAVAPLWCADQVQLAAEVAAAIGDDVGAGKGPSPVEARLGVVIRPRRWLAIGVRVGRGLVDELGAPRARAMLELTYRGAGRLL